MYGFWIIVIVLVIACVASFCIAFIPEHMEEHYKRKLRYMGKYGYITSYDGYSFDKKELEEHGLNIEEFDKNLAKKKFWCELSDCDVRDAFAGIGAITLIATVIFSTVAICLPIEARKEVAYWEEFAPMAESIIENNNTYETLGIAGDVIEYNKWLADARSSQKIYGNWSRFYGIDLSELEYIDIGQ